MKTRMKRSDDMFAKKVCAIVAALGATALFAASFPGTTFYWIGGSGNWSDTANWSMDSGGSTAATRYPGSDATITNDIAYFTASANGTITVD